MEVTFTAVHENDRHFVVCNVHSVELTYIKSGGKLARVWAVILNDGKQKTFKRKDYNLLYVCG